MYLPNSRNGLIKSMVISVTSILFVCSVFFLVATGINIHNAITIVGGFFVLSLLICALFTPLIVIEYRRYFRVRAMLLELKAAESLSERCPNLSTRRNVWPAFSKDQMEVGIHAYTISDSPVSHEILAYIPIPTSKYADDIQAISSGTKFSIQIEKNEPFILLGCRLRNIGNNDDLRNFLGLLERCHGLSQQPGL